MGEAGIAKKLAIKPGQRVIVHRCPAELHDAFKTVGAAFDRGTIAEITVSFVRMRAEIDNACKEGIALTSPGGMLWIAYPKKSGALRSDVSRDDGWEPFAQAGWRAVTLVALDKTWSALRFRPHQDVGAKKQRS